MECAHGKPTSEAEVTDIVFLRQFTGKYKSMITFQFIIDDIYTNN